MVDGMQVLEGCAGGPKHMWQKTDRILGKQCNNKEARPRTPAQDVQEKERPGPTAERTLLFLLLLGKIFHWLDSYLRSECRLKVRR